MLAKEPTTSHRPRLLIGRYSMIISYYELGEAGSCLNNDCVKVWQILLNDKRVGQVGKYYIGNVSQYEYYVNRLDFGADLVDTFDDAVEGIINS